MEYLYRAMRVEFGDDGAETMIGEIRKFIREQRRVEKDRRMREEQEERRRRWERDGETWESTKRGREKEMVEDTRGDEAMVVEERGKGGKGVGMSGGWFIGGGATAATTAGGGRSTAAKSRAGRGGQEGKPTKAE